MVITSNDILTKKEITDKLSKNINRLNDIIFDTIKENYIVTENFAIKRNNTGMLAYQYKKQDIYK